MGFMQLKGILKNALFPLKCRMCGEFFHPNDDCSRVPNGASAGGAFGTLFGNLMTQHLCPVCARQFMAAESPICMRCGLIFKSRQGEDHLCGECLQSEKLYGKARAAGVHDQALMSIMHAYKYGGKVQLAGPLSKLLTAVFEHHWQPDTIDLVLPIPLHPTRFRERGFNQAYLLVRSWGDIVARDILQRKRPTSPQTGLGRKERLRNVRGAFAVRDPLFVKNKRILLVDDVYTTGATVKECARMLKKCNAAQVDILTVGRAIT
jgi:ComF family protein